MGGLEMNIFWKIVVNYKKKYSICSCHVIAGIYKLKADISEHCM